MSNIRFRIFFYPFFHENGYVPKNQKISDLLHHSMSTWALVCIFLLHECRDTCNKILIHSSLCQGSTSMSRYADINFFILYPYLKKRIFAISGKISYLQGTFFRIFEHFFFINILKKVPFKYDIFPDIANILFFEIRI